MFITLASKKISEGGVFIDERYCNPSNLNGYRNGTAVWIDYDHSGTFEAAEKVYVTPQTTGIRGAHTETATINIPATATLGNTRMRVVNVEVQFDFNFCKYPVS